MIAGWLVPFSLRATVVFAAAWVIAYAMRHRAAARQHLVWSAAFALVLSMAVANVALPDWEILPVRSDSPLARWAGLVADAETASGAGASGGPSGEVTTGPRVELGMLLAGCWLLGCITLLARLGVGVWRIQQIERRSESVGADLERVAARLLQRLNVRREVRIVFSPGAWVPLTWGWRRHVIALPTDVRTQSADQVERILAHELAHVARRDAVVHTLARVVHALLWFHPFAWLGLRQLDAAAEAACDDTVLGLGSRPSDYAADLLALATCASVPSGACGFAAGNRLTSRIEAILDAARVRTPLRPSSVAVVHSLVLVVGVPFAVTRGRVMEQVAAAAQVGPMVRASMNRGPVPAPLVPADTASSWRCGPLHDLYILDREPWFVDGPVASVPPDAAERQLPEVAPGLSDPGVQRTRWVERRPGSVQSPNRAAASSAKVRRIFKVRSCTRTTVARS